MTEATTQDDCYGDGLGDPSTCQAHMEEWHRSADRCDAVLAARLAEANRGLDAVLAEIGSVPS